MSVEKSAASGMQRSVSSGWVVAAVLVVIGIIVPFLLKDDPYYVHIFILVFLFGYLATA